MAAGDRSGAVVAIGAPAEVALLALGGARVHAATSAAEARAAWVALGDDGDDVAVVVLTPDAAAAVTDTAPGRGLEVPPLTVVMPPWRR